MIPNPKLFNLTANKGLDVGGDILGLDLDCRYVSVSKGFGDVHFFPTGDEHFDTASNLRRHYADDEFEDGSSLLLWTLV